MLQTVDADAKKDLKESVDADLETTIVCGSSCFSAAAVVAAATEEVETIAVCGSSYFYYASEVAV